jgi:hypothetical protein
LNLLDGLERAISLILEIIFDWVGHRTARWLLPMISMGTVTVDSLTSDRSGFNWLGIQRNSDGSLLCSATMSSWIGVLFWLLSLASIIVVRESF